MAATLMLFDTQTQFMQPMRYTIGSLAYPLQSLRSLFGGGISNVYNSVRSRYYLIEESEELREEILQLRMQLMQMHIENRKNQHLRRLLEIADNMGQQAIKGASLLNIHTAQGNMLMTIDKGQGSSLEVGNVILDGWGLAGQVINVNLASSEVLLLTDSTHSLMAEVERTGQRVLVTGAGSLDRLEVHHVVVNADIVKGDRLLTSGLGGIYTAGYPVGEIVEIRQEAGEPYLDIVAKPAAHIASSNHFLIISANE